MSIRGVEALIESSRRQGLSLGNAEKDYVLSVALREVAGVEGAGGLVFKGGTCLRMAYFEGYRFSSDLDFAGREDARDELSRGIAKAFAGRTLEKVRFGLVKDLTLPGKRSVTLLAQYSSLIAGRPHVDSIRFDLGLDNPPLLAPDRARIAFPGEYGLDDVTVDVMPLAEILAEKVHAVCRRQKPRDLYDLWYLLRRGVGPDRALVERKLSALGAAFSMDAFAGRVARLGPGWDRDMRALVGSYPAFEAARADVMAALGAAWRR